MRPRRTVTRILTVCAGLATLSAGIVYASTELRLRRSYRVPASGLQVPADPEAIVRGQRLVHVVAQCTNCHGADLAGQLLGDDPWIGRLAAPNLTRGRGGVGSLSDERLVRSIRYGVGRDGRPLVMMPAQYLRNLSDGDLGAIIAYLRSLPPIDRELPPRRVGPLSRLAFFLGRVPDVVPAETLADASPPPPAPEPAISVGYGRYLVDTAGCRVCHRQDLRGGLHPLAVPGEPPPPDLTGAGPLGTWSERDFVHTLRTGITPEGRALDEAYMPWRRTGRMSDSELGAIWRYLRSLGPRRTDGARS